MLVLLNNFRFGLLDFLPTGAAAKALRAAAHSTGSEKFGTFLLDNVEQSKPVIRDAHIAARDAIRKVRPLLPIGLTLAVDDVQDAPGNEGHAALTRQLRYKVWFDAVRDDDYVGIQNYTRVFVDSTGVVPPQPGAALTQLHQEIYGPSLGNAVRQAAEMTSLPILVSEHGIGVADDSIRVRFIEEGLAGLMGAMRDGVHVTGYIHWSLLDNYEWSFGYKPKFGLIAVDRLSQRREPKPSAYFLGRIAKAGHINSKAS